MKLVWKPNTTQILNNEIIHYYVCEKLCVCVCVFMWFMRTHICIMTWVWQVLQGNVVYEDIFSVPIIQNANKSNRVSFLGGK